VPSPKPPVAWRIPGHRAPSLDEFNAGIEDFLMFANMHVSGDPQAPPMARVLDRTLQALADGKQGRFWGWPEWAVYAFLDIRSRLRDHWHLRRCRFCARWFLAKDSRRVQCCRVPCKREDARETSAVVDARPATRDGSRRRATTRIHRAEYVRLQSLHLHQPANSSPWRSKPFNSAGPTNPLTNYSMASSTCNGTRDTNRRLGQRRWMR
jgi:hypothetical protein